MRSPAEMQQQHHITYHIISSLSRIFINFPSACHFPEFGTRLRYSGNVLMAVVMSVLSSIRVMTASEAEDAEGIETMVSALTSVKD